MDSNLNRATENSTEIIFCVTEDSNSKLRICEQKVISIGGYLICIQIDAIVKTHIAMFSQAIGRSL